MRRVIPIVFVCFIAIAASAQNVGVGNTSPNSKLDLSGDLALREGTAIAVSAGANTLTLPTAKNSVYRLTGAAGAFSISSISGGNDGMLLTLVNATGEVMTITNGAIQTNTGADLVASTTVSSVNLLYNATLGKWLVVSGEGFSTNNTAWGLTGNSGTTPGTNFIGTTDAQDLPFKTANQENMRLAASGALGLGTKTPGAYANNTARIDIVDTTRGNLSDIEQLVVGGVGFGTHTFAVEGGTLSAPTAVASGQTIANIEGDVYTGTGFARAAQVIFSADGGVSSASSPGRIDFVTSPAGTAPTAGYIIGPVRMTIKNSGNVGINQNSPNSTLDVGGNIQISAASIPMGLMTEVEGTTPLLDMDINFREANKNTTYPGAAMRIDSRTGSPIFNWFYRPANNGAETDMMVLSTSGQLGIGTTSPAALLHISDTGFPSLIEQSSSATGTWLSLGNTGGGQWFQLIATGTSNNQGAGKLLITGGTAATFTTQNILTMVGSSGYVGVNNTSPAAQLDVAGTTRTTNLQMTSGGTSGYVMQSDASGNGSWVSPTGLGSYWTLSGANLYNNSGTSVGIGTSTPNAAVEITKAATDLLKLTSTTGNAGNHAYIDFETFAGSAVNGRIGALDMGSNNGSLVFEVGNQGMQSTTTTEAMRILNNGNVGIGTTSPTSPLSVLTPATGGNANWYDPVNYTGWIHDNSNAPQRYGLLVSDYWRASENWIFAVDGRLYGNGTINGDTHNPYLVVRGDGNVGVGTASPAYNLDVAGTMHVGTSANIAAWASQSIAASGYARMGGVLVQWGSGSYNSNNAVTVTFPTAFTNVYSVTATVDAGANTGSGSNIACKVLSTGTTSFQYAGTGVFSGDNVSKVRWMAIGN